MPVDPRAVAVARRAVEISGARGEVLPPDLAIFQLAGGRPAASASAGEPDDLGRLLETLTAAGDRQRHGVHYTPSALADDVLARSASSAPRSVGDPACGGGALLLAAGRRLVADGLTPDEAVLRLWGADLDPVAVATTEVALLLWSGRPMPPGRLRVADSLVDDLGWPPLDLVVGNPPFLGQLATATTTTRARATRLRERFGEAVRAYTDPAGLFLLLAVGLSGPAGRVAMILPQSLLGARDAAAIRAAVDGRGRLVDLWVPTARFGAAVDVCVVVVDRGGVGSVGWAAALASRLGVPTVDLGAGPTVGERATVLASFRQEYYGLLPALAEAVDAPDGRPVVTTGRIDLGGRRSSPVRLGRRGWTDPVVRPDRVEGRAGPWLERTGVPKVLVATQTKVVEVLLDPTGVDVPVTPVIAVVAPAAELPALAAALAAPPVSAWMAARVAGMALSPGALRITAPLVRAAPLPPDERAWRAGTAAFVAGDLDEFGAAMTAAYGADPSVVDWWRPRAERVWSPRE